MRTHFIQSKIT